MKKLILLTLAFVICGCVPNKPYSTVTKVEKAKSQYYTTHYKYVVTTDDDFRFYTDEIFHVGDTIQITKKKSNGKLNHDSQKENQGNGDNK